MEEQQKADAKVVYKRWRPISKSSGGVVGPVAYELGLDFADATLIRWVHYLADAPKTKRVKHNGKSYAWIHYPHFLKRYPMIGVANAIVLGRRISRLVQLGILERHLDKSTLRTMVFLRLTDFARQFLVVKLDAQNDLIHLAKEWVAYWADKPFPVATHKVKNSITLCADDVEEKAPKKESKKAPKVSLEEAKSDIRAKLNKDSIDLFGSDAYTYSERFVGFAKKVNDSGKYKLNLYDKNGVPYKTSRKIESMYNALLNGTFVEEFHPASKTYDFSAIGKVTEEEIWKAISGAPEYVDQLVNVFVHFNTKRSELLESIYRMRNYTPPVKHKEAPPKDDKYFNDFLSFSTSACSRIKWDDEKKAAAWALHKYYIRNEADIRKLNTCWIGTGVGDFGSALGAFMNKHPNWGFEAKDLDIDSYFWKQFALYILKARGYRILMDEGVYRKEAEKQEAKELLHEPRSYEYNPANVPDDPIFQDEW